MQAIKYLLVAAAVVCAAQAAEIPKSADKLDLRLFVDNGAAIFRNLYKGINTALDQSKPNADKILNELAPEARAMLRKLIDENRAKLKDQEKRVAFIFATLTKALDSLKPVKSCWEKVSPAGKKLALATEKDIVKIVEGAQKKYKKELDNLKLGQDKLVQSARKLFDTEVSAVVKCLTPGRKDSAACLQKEVDKTMKGVSEIIGNGFVLLQTAQQVLPPMLSEVLENMIPVFEKVLKDGQGLLKTLGNCVATLK